MDEAAVELPAIIVLPALDPRNRNRNQEEHLSEGAGGKFTRPIFIAFMVRKRAAISTILAKRTQFSVNPSCRASSTNVLPRAPRLLERREAAGDVRHVRDTHLLQSLGSQGRAAAGPAI